MKAINIKIKGELYRYQKNTTLLEISKNFQENFETPIVAAIVNNELKELFNKIEKDCTIEFIDLTHKDGWKIHRRSLSFVFIKACKDILEDAVITIDHTLNKGLYCEINSKTKITQEIINKIKHRMQELIDKDIPFIKTKIKKEDAIKIFQDNKQYEKVELLKSIDKQYINIYDLDGFKDYFYGYLVPSTGYLKLFNLIKIKDKENAVILLNPNRENPLQLTKYIYSPKLINIYEERKKWANIMGISFLSDLNNIIKNKEYPELIRTMEALHENKIAKIANMIANNPAKRIILIAGPSSSGKTSFAKRLALQLKVNGLKPATISLDDYFVNREDTPLDENGRYDFESIYAIDLKLFNKHLKELLEGNEIDMPTYNFITGKREFLGKKLKITKKQPIIIEGIHGLNPLLTSEIPDKNKFKIYISALTQLNIDCHNRIATTDTRLIRRIVRDNRTRGIDAKKTISMWESVRKGEKKNIFPFQEQADIMFNSALVYELSVLKKYIVPLLNKIKPEDKEYIEAKRLLSFLEYFKEIDEEIDIPPTSILREFIGGSRIV